MQYRKLGRSGTRVSQLCLGAMNFGWRTDEKESARIVDEAIDAGINFIDTADVYSKGVSEEIIGRTLQKNGKRDSVVLATKAAGRTGDGPNDQGLGRHHLSRAVDASLRRLKTDRIDLFYLHLIDIATPMDELFNQLDILVRQGKILYVGTSKWPAPLIVEGLMMHEKYGYPRITADQPPYNLCDRSIETELVWTCLRHGIGLCTFSPLAKGLLSGKYRRDKPLPENRRSSSKGFSPSSSLLEFIEKLVEIADAKGIDLQTLSHAWLQQRPGITCPIIGPRTTGQLQNTLKTAGITFSKAELDAIDEAIPPGKSKRDFYFRNTYAFMLRSIDNAEKQD